jgi:hypothetical protein
LCEIYDPWEPSWEGVPGNSYGVRTRTPDGCIVSWFKPAGKTLVQGQGDLDYLISALSEFEPEEAEIQSRATKAITPNFRPRSVPNSVLILYAGLSEEAERLAEVLRSDGLLPEFLPVGEEEELLSLSRNLERMGGRVQFGFILCTRREWRKGIVSDHAAVLQSQLGLQQVALLVRSKHGKRATSKFDLVQEFTFRDDIDDVLRECREYLYERVERRVQRHMKAVSDHGYRFMCMDNEVPALPSERKKPEPPESDGTPWEDEDDE